jgi:hypothetical protein
MERESSAPIGVTCESGKTRNAVHVGLAETGQYPT